MIPDAVMISSHAYALTLNLFVTIGATVLASIIFYRWRRRLEREEENKRKLIEAREKADAARHETLKGMITDNRKAMADKLDKICERFEEMDERFHEHEHLIQVNGSLIKTVGKVTTAGGI